MSAPPRVHLLTDAGMAAHGITGHPERPERLAAVIEGVEIAVARSGALLDRPVVKPVDDELLGQVHAADHVAALDALAGSGGGWIDADTHVARGSMAAARLAAGATAQAALAVARGEADVAFAAVRPPGHHASAERAAGFCLLNNVAIAVAALRRAGLAQRVAILDWDVHHGDGTQAIFDADPDLGYASTHQALLYPGTGHPDERGAGPAHGTMHNVPLRPGSGDGAFVSAWTERLLPWVEAFRPEALLVSAGYDAHADDPLAGLEVSAAGYGAVARGVGALARRLGLPGVALTLEGGYDLGALRESATATVRGLLEGMAKAPAG